MGFNGMNSSSRTEDSRPVRLKIDNAGAQELAQNAGYSQRTKHIDLRYHFLREVVAKRSVELESVPTKENVADIMTKPLPRESFELHRQSMKVIDYAAATTTTTTNTQ
jgi:hypothetical protein